MTSLVKLGEWIIEEDAYRDDGWKTPRSLLDIVKLGNFAWKTQRNICIRVLPFFEKYYYVPATEKLEEFLEKRNDEQFNLIVEKKNKPLPQRVSEKILSLNAGCYGIATGSVTVETKMSRPARELTLSWINRNKLDEELELWKLNMKSPYIKEKKKQGNCIPCIISSIVEANKPEDEADGMATEGTSKVKISLGSSTDTPVFKPKGECELTWTDTTKACIHGPVLYKVLPLEVGPTGRITPKEDSKGFIEERIVSDSDGTCGQFSSVRDDPTVQSSVKDIEELLNPLIGDQTVVDAFKATSIDDIHYLCHLVQDCPKAVVDVPNNMSKICRDILLFAKFQCKESGRLILEAKSHQTLASSYYLTAILAEVPTPIRQLISQSTVNLFPLLKGILIGTSLKDMVIDDGILKCTDTMQLLEMLDIRVNGSAVDGIPESLELLANVVWLALLYDGPTRAVQQ